MADSYDKLERLCLKYMNEDDFSKVEQAYCFAAEKHCNQKRRSGEMYINHPVEVAIILADLKMDCDVVCAALLHDTVEDTETSLADVSGLFGDTVAELVDGVTKLTNIEVDSMDEKQALTLRKMFLAMSKDIRVIIVKLADRLHNMRTLAALREDRRLFKARETMDVYAPLADRLGMSSIKWELEDLSFFYLEPDATSASRAWWRSLVRSVSAIWPRPSRRSPTSSTASAWRASRSMAAPSTIGPSTKR